jgi:hypothetical protein
MAKAPVHENLRKLKVSADMLAPDEVRKMGGVPKYIQAKEGGLVSTIRTMLESGNMQVVVPAGFDFGFLDDAGDALKAVLAHRTGLRFEGANQ